MRRLEATLFLAREPLSSRKLSQYAILADGTEARTLVRQLNQTYDGGDRAFRVEEVAGGFQLLTRPSFASWIRQVGAAPAETRLSPPAMETLAVVAFRQPVIRAEIEAIRGVACGEILRQLMERDLVRIDGRSEDLGRPYLYATNNRFLQLFGLKSLDDLPKAPTVRTTLSGGSEHSSDTMDSDPLSEADPKERTSDHSSEESNVSATLSKIEAVENDDSQTLETAELTIDSEARDIKAEDDSDSEEDSEEEYEIDDDDEDDFDEEYDDDYEGDEEEWEEEDEDEEEDEKEDGDSSTKWVEVGDDDDEDEDEDEEDEDDDEDEEDEEYEYEDEDKSKDKSKGKD